MLVEWLGECGGCHDDTYRLGPLFIGGWWWVGMWEWVGLWWWEGGDEMEGMWSEDGCKEGRDEGRKKKAKYVGRYEKCDGSLSHSLSFSPFLFLPFLHQFGALVFPPNSLFIQITVVSTQNKLPTANWVWVWQVLPMSLMSLCNSKAVMCQGTKPFFLSFSLLSLCGAWLGTWKAEQ